MSAALALDTHSTPVECWQLIVGYGVRHVLLRRFIAGGMARVSKECRGGGWEERVIDVHPRNLFLWHNDALAEYRRQPRRKLKAAAPAQRVAA